MPTLRDATSSDAEAIAALHADSWRRNYRGAYDDAFLDGDVDEERLGVWTERLTDPSPDSQVTIVAEHDGAVVGFAHTIFDADAEWGALLDNLHVVHHLKGQGLGRRLVERTARAVVERRPGSGLYLWVLEQNTAAQAFYDALGGTRIGREIRGPVPGGGTAPAFRYAWPDPRRLLEPRA
jgi:ribosomal protein S18 acetylase RimI-like enzyme